MRRKKLKKLLIDEAARTFRVLSKEEQRAIKGGEFYFSQNGDFLGMVGLNQEIRIIDEDIFRSQMACDSGSFLSSYSVGLTETDVTTQYFVMNYIADSMGIYSVSLYGKFGTGGAKWTPGGGIQINVYSNSYTAGNYYDICLMLVHEKQHQDTPDDFGASMSEYEAYKATVEHPYFQYASEGFQKTVSREYEKIKAELGI